MRIGILSEFLRSGFGYTSLDIRKVFLKYNHTVCVLTRNREDRLNEEFNCISDVSYYTEKNIPVDIIKYWIKKNNLTHCIFIGSDSKKELDDILYIQRRLKLSSNPDIKFISIPMWENVEDVGKYHFFDRIICPTKKCKEVFKKYFNAVYVKWGFDEDIFFPLHKEFNNTIKIFHPVGKDTEDDLSGKVPSLKGFLRKNRIKVDDKGNLHPEFLLYVHTHLRNGDQPENYNLGNMIIGKQNLSRGEMAILYQSADICLLPSKVEGLGLSFLEALGTGLPIITIDEAPMNEYVVHKETGYLCDRENLENNIDSALQYFEDKATMRVLKQNVLSIREEWSWKNNGEKLMRAIL